ncbi:O-antigen ligase family protein [Cetobacterium sp.]|uniref:O-antigen ligase family protein n=1 Tax=Cetobacterium sp. TaxID=2071632 RepID=UPI003F364BAE
MILNDKEYEKIALVTIGLTLLIFLTRSYFRALSFMWILTGAIHIKRFGYRKTGMEISSLIYIGALFLSLTFALDAKYSYKEIYRHLYGFIPLFFLTQVYIERKLKEQLTNVICLVMTLYFFVLNILITLQKLPTKSHGRAVPLNIMPVEFCFLAGVALIYMFAYYLKCENKNEKYLNLLAVILMSYVIIQTKTRGAWLGLIGALAVIYILNSKEVKKAIITISAAIFSSGFLFYIFRFNSKIAPIYNRVLSIANTKTDVSNGARLVAWKLGLDRFLEKKLTGWGYKVKMIYETGALGANQRLEHPHSDYISYLVATGVIGLFSYLYFMFVVAKKALSNKDDIFWLSMLGIVVYIMIYGTVESLFQVTNSLFLFLFFLSLCLIEEGKSES